MRGPVLWIVGAAAFCAVSVGFALSGATGAIHVDVGGLSTPTSGTSPLSVLAAPDAPYIASALLARPVFSPSRSRPIESSGEIAAPPPPPPPGRQEPLAAPSYVVGGVIVAPGIRKTLLRQDGGEAGAWLRHGESTPDGWTVAFIAPDRVVVERLGQHFDLVIPGRTAP
jgi:hypothetical protein